MLRNIKEVDEERIAAMGWCMGGHPILELSRMNVRGVKALVTFHGVFDGIVEEDTETSKDDHDHDDHDNDHDDMNISTGRDDENNKSNQKCALICNGMSDPFVSLENLDVGKRTFEKNLWETKVLNFENVKHGFTNPAQDYNPSEAFGYNDDAAKASWEAAKNLLRKQLLI